MSLVVVLDCEITALVNHWQRLLRVGFIVDKLLGIIIIADEFIGVSEIKIKVFGLLLCISLNLHYLLIR